MALLIAMVLVITTPLVLHFGLRLKSGKLKAGMVANLICFGIVCIGATALMLHGGDVFAATGSTGVNPAAGFAYIGAALATGLAAIGAGIAVAAAAAAAIGAISEDSAIMGKALIFVALAEGIALYGLLISFMIIGQI